MSDRNARLASVARVAISLALACAALGASRGTASVPPPEPSVAATPAAPPPSPEPLVSLGPADCTLVGADDAARILGYPVDVADEASARGGICFFPTRSVSQEGSLGYALVTQERLPQRRAFFRAAARRCGSVAKGSSNELVCRAYRNLASVVDLASYFTARTDFPDATAIPKLGDAAVAAPDAVFVRRGTVVYECAVRRAGELDVGRSTELARLLLARAPQS